MISVEEASARMLAAVKPLGARQALLAECSNRYSAVEIRSPLDLPLFDNSAMDGYAVRSPDLQNASSAKPALLKCATRIAAGQAAIGSLEQGTCARVFTGSILPAGSDAVVMQEDVSVEENSVIFREGVRPLENVRLKGEDLRRNAVLVRPGDKLTPARIGLLAATGHAAVMIYRPCKVALLATGNELVEPGEQLRPGQIFESNRSMIAALLAESGAEIQSYPIVKDDLAATGAALSNAFAEADLVISSGGVSVGEFDFVKDALSSIGGTVDLWQIAMRPGKPFTFGRLGGKFLFGLPGNPVSAFVTFVIMARPAILKLQGAAEPQNRTVPAECAESMVNRGDRRHFVRVRFDQGKVRLAGPQKSHMIGSLGSAHGLLDIPAESEFKAGDRVEVILCGN